MSFRPGRRRRPLIVGLSGSSASGKTTVARLVRDIFTQPSSPSSSSSSSSPSSSGPGMKVTILHGDDFYLPEAQLPTRDGLVNWDCAGSLDVGGMVDAIRHLGRTGEVPPGFTSKEDRNETGPSGVGADEVARLTDETRAWLLKNNSSNGEEGTAVGDRRELFIIEGFLLFGNSVKELRDCFDLRLLLRASYEKGKQRRENRTGYATIEGFWTDPPGYWDSIVWPEYVEEHSFMFKDGNVEGEPDEATLKEIGVDVVPGGGDLAVQEMLVWVLSKVKDALVDTSTS